MHDPDERYSRQVRFAPFGERGQRRLRAARVAVVGLGGLGSTSAAHLARAGVGELILIDRDIVEVSNLPRQMLFDEEDAHSSISKAEAAARHLAKVASSTRLTAHAVDVTAETIATVCAGVDLVVDGLDSFETRFLLNDYCRREQIAWVYGGAVGSLGAVLLMPAGPDTACLRCVFEGAEESPSMDTCETVGVLSPLPALIASLQAAEALRFLAEDQPEQRLWNLDPWTGRAFVARLARRADCPCCGDQRYPALERANPGSTVRLCGRDTVQVQPALGRGLDLTELGRRWEGVGKVHRSRFLVRLDLGTLQISVFADGRALIQGLRSLERARSLYAQYIGS